MNESRELTDYIREALTLVPEGELLSRIEADNNFTCTPDGRVLAGCMDATIVTFSPDGRTEKTYQVVCGPALALKTTVVWH